MIIPLVLVIVVTTLIGCDKNNQHDNLSIGTHNERTLITNISITDELLFSIPPRELYERYDFNILFKIFRRLRDKVLKNDDITAMDRFLALWLESDASISTALVIEFYEILQQKPGLFFRYTSNYTKNKEQIERLYLGIIVEFYKEIIASNIIVYKPYSELFLNIYYEVQVNPKNYL